MIPETFISVDIEASGPIPGEFSMLSLGACVVGHMDAQFYVELKPTTRRYDADAMRVSGFDLDALERTGTDPAEAMAAFESWTLEVTPPGQQPVFVAFPIAFDWMFVAYYFHRFLARNPFGVAGLDLTSYYAGSLSTSLVAIKDLDRRLAARMSHTHNALDDAVAQARVFEQLLDQRRRGQAS